MMPEQPVQPPAAAPKAAYTVFYGPVDQANGQKIVNFLSLAMNDKYDEIHMVFQTAGGFVGDGMFLNNLWRVVPMKIVLYNVGQISSAGVVAYAGAPVRKVSKFATFMLHASTNPALMANAAKLAGVTKGLIMDDQRTQAILKQVVQMPDDLWNQMAHDLYLSAEDAVQYGLATEIGDFAPPPGTRVFQVNP